MRAEAAALECEETAAALSEAVYCANVAQDMAQKAEESFLRSKSVALCIARQFVDVGATLARQLDGIGNVAAPAAAAAAPDHAAPAAAAPDRMAGVPQCARTRPRDRSEAMRQLREMVEDNDHPTAPRRTGGGRE